LLTVYPPREGEFILNISAIFSRKMLLAAALLALTGSAASAAHYTFTQTGFDGGGSVNGSFDAVDDDHSGWIDTWNDPTFKNFQFTFSGDSLVGDFTSHRLLRLTYKIGSDIIGLTYDSGESLPVSFMSDVYVNNSVSPFSRLFTFDAYTTGGVATDFTLGTTSSTVELIRVSDVPLPTSAWLFVTGIAGLVIKRRKDNLSAIVA
jgi:hypothetical protein